MTIGPAFLSAAIYLSLARIVVVYGESFSRLKPRTYSILFISFDFLALLLQAAGGAIAATADAGSSSQDTGVNIMIAGLAMQVFSLLLFMGLCLDFAWAARKNHALWNPTYSSLRANKIWKAFLIGRRPPVFLSLFLSPLWPLPEHDVIISGGFFTDNFLPHSDCPRDLHHLHSIRLPSG